jgi:hypothetical protein
MELQVIIPSHARQICKLLNPTAEADPYDNFSFNLLFYSQITKKLEA